MFGAAGVDNRVQGCLVTTREKQQGQDILSFLSFPIFFFFLLLLPSFTLPLPLTPHDLKASQLFYNYLILYWTQL